MIKRILKQYLKNQRFKQALALSMVNVINIPLSVISSIIITRFLGPSSYGDFKFLLNVFKLSVVIFSFGFFQAGNRALVLNHDLQKGREIYGAMLIILSILFTLMGIFLLSYAFFDNNIYEKGLQIQLIYLIPFSWVFLFVRYFETLFQADNKIKLLANSRLLPKLAFFISVLIIYFFYLNYNGNKLTILLGLFLMTQILVFIYIIYKINPSFNNVKTRIREIFTFNKSFGFNVYIGSLTAVGFSQLTGILISYFAKDNSGVGFYSLAATISAPLSFIPNVIATTHYKDFSTSKNISRKLMLITFIISCTALSLTLLLVSPFIKYFYGPEFNPVIYLTYIVSFGVILFGYADFFNRFLGAHGKGKALRNSAVLVGFSTMVFNFTLIPRFGESGAAYTLVFSGMIYVLCMLWYYQKVINNLEA